MFVLNGVVEHFQYTDSGSARQLACRQGCGRVRHVAGKLLWVQEKTADKSFDTSPCCHDSQCGIHWNLLPFVCNHVDWCMELILYMWVRLNSHW